MDCFGTYSTHAQTCDNVPVQSATQWTASLHTSHMHKTVITFVFKVLRYGLLLRKRIEVLVAARLHRCPGLFSVLAALKEYREACSKGTCAVSPSNAFQPDALDWFEPQEEKTS